MVVKESQRVNSIQWTRACCGNKTALRSSYRIKVGERIRLTLLCYCCSATKLCPALVIHRLHGPHGPHQAPLSMGLPRQEYWIELLLPSPGNLPDPGIKPWSPALAGGFLITEPPGKP